MDRRDFLKNSVVGAVGLAAATEATGPTVAQQAGFAPLKKAVTLSMLPKELSLPDRFKLARAVGFDGVEVPPLSDAAQIAEMRAAADASGIRLHSIIFGGLGAPVPDDDRDAVAKAQQRVRDGLQCANTLGADALLLVPGRVTATTRYTDAYEVSQRNIRPLLADAERLGVVIAIENVWNNFLLSPLEFVRYVDEFKSPWLQAYFDVGNVVYIGWPQDWIRTLGKRVRKVHLKDYTRKTHEWMPLREGDVDWPEVRRALAEVGYDGWLTCELRGGDEVYLRDVSARVDKIIAGE